MSSLETFLGSVESITSARKEPRTRLSGLVSDGFAYLTPYRLRRTSDSALTYPPASSHHFIDSRDEWHGRGSFRRLFVVAQSRSIDRSFAPPRSDEKSLARRKARAPLELYGSEDRDICSRESKLTSVVAEYERLGHRLRFSASA